MKILSLNTQKAFNPSLLQFLLNVLRSGEYDFIVLQEAVSAIVMGLKEIGLYSVVNSATPDSEQETQLAVLYRDPFKLEKTELTVFPYLYKGAHPHAPAYGFLLTTFHSESEVIRVGSVHLHAGVRPSTRKDELTSLAETLKAQSPDVPTIFGGDFNFGLPGEIRNAQQLLAPHFSLVTRKLGPTLDSRYTEPYPVATNYAARALAMLGIGVQFRTDHFFVDSQTYEKSNTQARVLADRVSDHSPIVIELLLAQ